MNNTIDKPFLIKIRSDIDAALAAIAEQYGMSELAIGKMTYDTTAGTFSTKLKGTVGGGLGEDAALYEQIRTCNWWMPPIGTSIELRGKHFTIAGMRRGRRISLKDDNGTAFTMKADAFDRKFPQPSAAECHKHAEAKRAAAGGDRWVHDAKDGPRRLDAEGKRI